MHLGIVISAGGSAFATAAQIVREEEISFTVITDRKCSGEAAARNVGANVLRIQDNSRSSFSRKVGDTFSKIGVSSNLLFFDRLVSAELFEALPTYNIHPAALPAFPGLKGVENAYAYRARLLGCSLHKVDVTMDGGPLIAQIARGVDPNWPIARWQKIAYLMKVYCTLVWISQEAEKWNDSEAPINASHGLPKIWINRFKELQMAERADVI